jgi:membrane protein required for colicin V production
LGAEKQEGTNKQIRRNGRNDDRHNELLGFPSLVKTLARRPTGRKLPTKAMPPGKKQLTYLESLGNTPAMNWLDITILVICVAGMIQGLVRGFVRQVFSLIGLILAIIIAFRYHDLLARYLSKWIQHPVALTVVSFVIILAIVMLLFKLIGLAARAAIATIHVGWVDRLVGGVFGLLRSVLLVAVLFALFVICTDKPTKPMIDSRLTPSIMEVSRIIARFLPTQLYERYARNEEKIKRQLGAKVPSGLREEAGEPTSL